MILSNSITDVKGIRVGHAQDEKAITGCTVVLCENGATGGVDQRGGAPGTRETDALKPMHLVNSVHAVLLTGGSAFGLDAASGVMRYLEEKNIGYNTGLVRIPIVPAAVLFDLGLGDPKIRPNADMGYLACQNASATPPKQGNAGAGIGASVGKILGMGQAMKSGIGTASINIGNGIIVGAIVAVNAFGDIIDPESGIIIAGARTIHKGPIKIGESKMFANTLHVMQTTPGKAVLSIATRHNTIIGVVATNAILDKEEVNKVAQMAHNGLAVTVRPAHTMLDGDTIFALSTNKKRCDVSIIGAFAAQVLEKAILNAVRYATPLAGLPAAAQMSS